MSKSKQSLPMGKGIDWEDVNIKAGIAFTIVSVGIAVLVYLIFQVQKG